jgi:hydroxypyruvate isomerase
MSLARRQFLAAGVAGAAAASALSSAVAQEDGADIDISKLGKTPHTKFAVNIEMWFRRLPFLDRIKKVAEFGFPGYEFWDYKGKDLPAIAKLTADLGLECAQFTAWGFEPGMNNPANEDRCIAQIEEACGLAKAHKIRKVTVVAGNNQRGMSQEAMLAQVVKTLKRAAPIAEKHGIMLILEPMNGRVDHPGHCLYGSVDAVKICREVGSPMVKINWDLYHMQISEGDLCGRLKEGFDQVGYLQVADHPGRNEPDEPGTGEIHYNRVLKQAIDLGYKDFVGLECRPKTTEVAAAQGVAKADVW